MHYGNPFQFQGRKLGSTSLRAIHLSHQKPCHDAVLMDIMTNFKGIQKMKWRASARTSKIETNDETNYLRNLTNVCRNGEQIENYEGIFANMDCECAVVESMITGLRGIWFKQNKNLTQFTGWGLKPSCTADGSYNKKQCKGGKCYCVDRWDDKGIFTLQMRTIVLLTFMSFRYGRQCEKEKLDSEPISCDGAGDPNHPDKAPEKCP